MHEDQIEILLLALQSTYQDMSVAAKEVVLGQVEALKAKCDEAVEARKKAEQDIETLRPVRTKLMLAE